MKMLMTIERDEWCPSDWLTEGFLMKLFPSSRPKGSENSRQSSNPPAL